MEQFESRHQPPIEVRVQQSPKPRFLPHSTTSKDSGKVPLRCIKHQCDCCGPVSTLNNPGMAWTKESHGKRKLKRRPLICELLWLRTCLSEELLENSIASKSHFEGKNTCTLLYLHPDRNRSPWSRGA